MTKSINCVKFAAVVLAFCVASAVGLSAQTLTTLYAFDVEHGNYPENMNLVQGLDGDFYGTTEYGGNQGGGGTVFKIDSAGNLTMLYSFCGYPHCGGDGSFPVGGLVLTADGNFYGTTLEGGANSSGTVYRLTADGTETILYNFCSRPSCADGSIPYANLIEASDGNLYGTTNQGGSNTSTCQNSGCGTVFQITPNGILTTLYSFCGQPLCADGALPAAGLVEGSDGSLYGTTIGGGIGDGVIFKISRHGTFSVVHTLVNSDGGGPWSGLVQGSTGFYGTAAGAGGANYGTVYKLTPSGVLAAQSFFGTNGAFPFSTLSEGTDGNFYGTTVAGGAGSVEDCKSGPGCGTLFRFGPGRSLMTLYTFCLQFPCGDGTTPTGGLVQGTDGGFYGTTTFGGFSGNGTVFVLDVSLGPFIKTVPTSGTSGSSVFILGNNLTGTTSVTFNRTPAAFTVVSPTEITTTVPTGATSGTVQVTTLNGTLNSNVVFRVN